MRARKSDVPGRGMGGSAALWWVGVLAALPRTAEQLSIDQAAR